MHWNLFSEASNIVILNSSRYPALLSLGERRWFGGLATAVTPVIQGGLLKNFIKFATDG